jgi:hypothetical protein
MKRGTAHAVPLRLEQIIGEQVSFEGEIAGAKQISTVECRPRAHYVVANLAHRVLLIWVEISLRQLLQITFRGTEKLLGGLAVTEGLFCCHAGSKLCCRFPGTAVADHFSPVCRALPTANISRTILRVAEGTLFLLRLSFFRLFGRTVLGWGLGLVA